MSWTQPICERCWIVRNSDETSIRRPVRLLEPEIEQCAYCGGVTIFGAYVRDDPASVPFPDERDDDPE